MPTDDDLLTAIHTAHAADLHRYVSRLTRGTPEADDVVQEALLRLWKHPEVLERPDDSVRAWLFTVARNLVVDHLRSARHVRERVTDSLPDPGRADETQTILDAWLIADGLSELTADHRAVVVGAYYGGRSVAELAAEHGVPPGTIKSRLHYGLRALRLALQEKGVTP